MVTCASCRGEHNGRHRGWHTAMPNWSNTADPYCGDCCTFDRCLNDWAGHRYGETWQETPGRTTAGERFLKHVARPDPTDRKAWRRYATQLASFLRSQLESSPYSEKHSVVRLMNAPLGPYEPGGSS